ncbi:MAG: hypothetical protein KGL90_05755 [Burkholderiales bacterium]|nr:hypothetical protein [Burkholderiales bacterium]
MASTNHPEVPMSSSAKALNHPRDPARTLFTALLRYCGKGLQSRALDHACTAHQRAGQAWADSSFDKAVARHRDALQE